MMTLKDKMLDGASAPVLNLGLPAVPPLLVNGRKASVLKYAHKQVVEVAKGLAHELYDTMMKNNESYAVWQAFCQDIGKDACEDEFIHLSLPYLLDDARATLAGMLGQMRYSHLHESIYDALINDNLVRGAKAPRPVKHLIEESYRGRRS